MNGTFLHNINDAFSYCLKQLNPVADAPDDWSQWDFSDETSRNGNVRSIIHPVGLTYTDPHHRVLFNDVRDPNHFFHMYETMWMFAGRNDVESLNFYNSKYGDITSDDGVTANGAYGYRWRRNELCDQLKIIVDQLQRKNDSRRTVLQMWNVQDDLLKIDDSKDVCCNLGCMFRISQGRLHMTVTNRSNDLLWGMLGANYVHFSFLHEYIALSVGVLPGTYTHMTSNLHAYTDRSDWKPRELWKATRNPYMDPNFSPRVPLLLFQERFDEEVHHFCHKYSGSGPWEQKIHYGEPFLNQVAQPICRAWHYHKVRDYNSAFTAINQCMADDWRIACTSWLMKREKNYVNRTATSGKG